MSEAHLGRLVSNVVKLPNKIEPLEPRIKHLSDFYGKPINPPEYVVDELIPKGRVTLFAGKAGFGKSYAALMLMIAAATERQWLNKNVRKCKSFGLFSEDPDEEIQRRLVNICVYYDIDMRDIEDFAPYLSADDGEIELFTCFRRHGAGTPRTLWSQIEQRCADEGTELIILDNVINIFCGDPNSRTHVNSFMRYFNGAAKRLGCAIVVLCNPPKDTSKRPGDRGAYFSGTQTWEDSARNTISLNAAEDQQGNERPGEFVLKIMKNNYIPYNHPMKRKGITLEWQNDVLVPIDVAEPKPLDALGMVDLESRILKAVDRFTNDLGQKCSVDQLSPNYLPSKLSAKKQWQHIAWPDLVAAFERLLADERLIKVAVKDKLLCRTPSGKPYLGESE